MRNEPIPACSVALEPPWCPSSSLDQLPMQLLCTVCTLCVYRGAYVCTSMCACVCVRVCARVRGQSVRFTAPITHLTLHPLTHSHTCANTHIHTQAHTHTKALTRKTPHMRRIAPLHLDRRFRHSMAVSSAWRRRPSGMGAAACIAAWQRCPAPPQLGEGGTDRRAA